MLLVFLQETEDINENGFEDEFLNIFFVSLLHKISKIDRFTFVRIRIMERVKGSKFLACKKF